MKLTLLDFDGASVAIGPAQAMRWVAEELGPEIARPWDSLSHRFRRSIFDLFNSVCDEPMSFSVSTCMADTAAGDDAMLVTTFPEIVELAWLATVRDPEVKHVDLKGF